MHGRVHRDKMVASAKRSAIVSLSHLRQALLKLKEELAQEVEQAVDRQGESEIIHPLSEKLLQNEGALSEKLASYQNSKLEYQQLVSEIEQIESKIADIQKIERKLEEEHPRK